MNITLTFLRSELLYDIKNRAYTMADVMPADSEHMKHQLADIGEEGNADTVTRIMDLAMSFCKENLYAYTKTPVEDNAQYDDVFRETDKYTMKLNVHEKFSQTSAEYLTNLIHNFIIYKVLYEWLSMTDWGDNDKRKTWFLVKANEIMDEIHRALFVGYIGRRPLNPF